MLPSRKSGFPWLLLLVLVCSLLGRPLHEAWHIAHSSYETEGGAVKAAIAVDHAQALDAQGAGTGSEETSADDDGEEGDSPLKADACAWCLFHAQAAPCGHVPESLLTHAEASPPPAILPSERVPSRHWGVAEPRGPPAA